MKAMICMLRGVNVGGHNIIRMDALRGLCEEIGLRKPQTYVQSGNVVFLTAERNEERLAKRLEEAIEKKFGFRPGVILRTTEHMREIVARNPFPERANVEPAKLLVSFLFSEPSPETRAAILHLDVGSEEVKIDRRELYIYFPDGQGRSKLPPLLDRVLQRRATGRNWNTVTKLLEMAEKLET